MYQTEGVKASQVESIRCRSQDKHRQSIERTCLSNEERNKKVKKEDQLEASLKRKKRREEKKD